METYEYLTEFNYMKTVLWGKDFSNISLVHCGATVE
jgi:hypothetical protein